MLLLLLPYHPNRVNHCIRLWLGGLLFSICSRITLIIIFHGMPLACSFNPLDSYIWFELYGSPSDRDVTLIGSVCLFFFSFSIYIIHSSNLNYYTGYSSMVCHGSSRGLQFFKLAGTYPILTHPIHSLHAHLLSSLSLSIATSSVLLGMPYLNQIYFILVLLTWNSSNSGTNFGI